MNQDQLPGQMTIFDFLTPPERPLEDLPESEMVKMITDATGLKFRFIDSFWGWQVKERGVLFSVQYDNYLVDDKRRFIGADWNANHQGQCSPCDSVQEAIDFFRKAIRRLDEGTRRFEQKGEL